MCESILWTSNQAMRKTAGSLVFGPMQICSPEGKLHVNKRYDMWCTHTDSVLQRMLYHGVRSVTQPAPFHGLTALACSVRVGSRAQGGFCLLVRVLSVCHPWALERAMLVFSLVGRGDNYYTAMVSLKKWFKYRFFNRPNYPDIQPTVS